jgi:predicted nuclease with TOPRIM domain
MPNKEKDSEMLTKTAVPGEKTLNKEALEAKSKEKMEYHNTLAHEKDRLTAELNKVTEHMILTRGEFNLLQSQLKEYYDTNTLSDNGSA